ncbi:hypothetical protein HAX54_031436 [Datura stramonium]|uniref:Uncharacterized protein n=1 Tax=Datura stramonium TaxID=4076 RepID=A0ABS8SBW1_DATST|nr:hypothetical protein [Datura stramonium]
MGDRNNLRERDQVLVMTIEEIDEGRRIVLLVYGSPWIDLQEIERGDLETRRRSLSSSLCTTTDDHHHPPAITESSSPPLRSLSSLLIPMITLVTPYLSPATTDDHHKPLFRSASPKLCICGISRTIR